MESSFVVPVTCTEAFSRLADPRLLDVMTPTWFRLQILTSGPMLTVGSQIHYRIRWRGFPFRWQSEITHWQSPHRFTYRQVRGPFKYFEHEHLFQEEEGGTRVTDRIRFHAPGGSLVQRAIVAPELRRILSHRRRCAIDRLADPRSRR
ncbi:MAG: SRPBCC family protein [Thermoanaerobaculia bacterium]